MRGKYVPCRASTVVLVCALLVSAAVASDNKWARTIVIPSQQAVDQVPVAGRHETVVWLKTPLAIDGGLDDWAANDIQPVSLAGPDHIQWTRGGAGDAKDTAAFSLARDAKGLYLAVRTTSNELPLPRRIDVSFDTLNNDKVITGWRDVGERYDSDDNHFVFTMNDGNSKVRVAQINGKLPLDAATVASVQAHATTTHGARVLEVFFPWQALSPYDPAGYKPMKFNLAVLEATPAHAGVIGWTAGLEGTYSAGHFGTLTFATPPAGSPWLEMWASISGIRYVDQTIPVKVTVSNHGKAVTDATLTVTPTSTTGKRAATQQVALTLKHGVNETTVKFPSEKVGAGDWSFDLHLSAPGGKALAMAADTSTASNTVLIKTIAQINAMLQTLADETHTLAAQYEKMKAAGADATYSLAYRTLYQMFVDRCAADLKAHRTARVEANCDRLAALFPAIKAYNEQAIADPSKSLRVPARFKPSELKIRDGYYRHDDKAVFLWGPNMFWFMRKDLPKVRDMGFNTQAIGEPPFFARTAEANQYFADSQKWGIAVDMQIGFGAAYKLAKKVPELANRDANNFMPLIIQNPKVKQAEAAWFGHAVPLVKDRPAVITYTVANEPWYLNYSEETRHDFINTYLKPKYKTIDNLNRRWHSHYKAFNEIRLITWPDPKNRAPWYDFQTFRDQLLRDHFAFLKKCVHDLDPTRPIGVKFMAMSLQSFNMELLEGLFDFNDFDGSMGNRDTVFLDFCRSLWPNKPLVNTEVHIGYAGVAATESAVWRLALHGLAGGDWWGWHPNAAFVDTLGNADSMYALAKAGLDIQRLVDPYLVALNHKPSPIATLFPNIVERRTDRSIVRIRYEEAAAQYPLGIQPFYATEARIADGELSKHQLLLAGESDYISDKTYDAIRAWVSHGGRLIVLKGGMAHDAWGEPRDTSGFIHPDAGQMLCDGARVYSYGKGEVICVNGISAKYDIVRDGGEALQGRSTTENTDRRATYHRVLLAVMKRYSLMEPVRLESAKGMDPVRSAFGALDWRAVKVNDAWVICTVESGAKGFSRIPCRLVTPRPVKSITNLITGKRLDPTSLIVGPKPMLLRLELNGPVK